MAHPRRLLPAFPDLRILGKDDELFSQSVQSRSRLAKKSRTQMTMKTPICSRRLDEVQDNLQLALFDRKCRGEWTQVIPARRESVQNRSRKASSWNKGQKADDRERTIAEKNGDVP